MTDLLQEYTVNTIKKMESGELASFPDPSAPSDLGTALNQEQIDQLKTLLNELNNRFILP